jgi:hypothetical protein
MIPGHFSRFLSGSAIFDFHYDWANQAGREPMIANHSPTPETDMML